MQNRVEVIEDEDVARSVPASGAKSCACCKKQDPALKRCGKCKQVSYCSIDCQKKHFPEHKKLCSKESASAEELWAKHEARLAKKQEEPPKLEKAFASSEEIEKAKAKKELLNSRHDANEIELLKTKAKHERLGVLLKGGEDDFNVEPILVDPTELTKRSEPARLIQAASSIPVMVFIRGTGEQRNEAANKLMTRLEIGFADGKYQLGVGDVIVFRSDGRDLNCADAVFCYDFAGFVISDYLRQRRNLSDEELKKLWETDVKFKKHKFE